MKPKSLVQHRMNTHSSELICSGELNHECELVQSDELIQNIDDAKNWLEKAKDEFISSNAVRGGLNLSLAQAEVQRAWELSREQCVSTLQKLPPAANRSRKSSLLLPLAAGFGILMLIAGAFAWFQWQHPGMINPALQLISQVTSSPKASLDSAKSVSAQKMPIEPTVVKAAPVIHKKSTPHIGVISPRVHPVIDRLEASPNQKPMVAVHPVEEQPMETLKEETPVAKETPKVSETIVAEAPPVVKNEPAVHETSSAAATENPHRNTTASQVEPAAAVNTGRVQAALQLPEDDLANIAKRSLKSGR